MKPQILIFIQGDWDGGHNGHYPIICELREYDKQNPISLTEGWGHGIGGGYFSFQQFLNTECTNILYKKEALWLNNAIKHVVKNSFDHKKSCEYILLQGMNNWPIISESLYKHLKITT